MILKIPLIHVPIYRLNLDYMLMIHEMVLEVHFHGITKLEANVHLIDTSTN